MKNLLIGQCVIQRKVKGTIVDYAEQSRHLLIKWDDDCLTKTYVFPDVFLSKQYDMSPDEDSKKLKQALSKYDIYKCSKCHGYSKDLRKVAKYKLCPTCAKTYRLCSECHGLFDDVQLGLDGRYRCRQCFDAKYPSIHANLTLSKTELPIIHIRRSIPWACSNQHKMFCVTAKVTVVRNEIYQNAKINLHYCKDCNRYYCLERSFEKYAETYGYICLPRDEPHLHYAAGQSRAFKEDSILSRWGYSTDLPEPKRRQILSFLLRSQIADKSQLASILHTFSGRQWLKYAPSIWLDDLHFVEEYGIEKQPLVDFTRP